MRRLAPVVALACAAALFGAVNTAGATHSWENYHWARSANPVNLQVADSLVGEWDSYLPQVIADWNQSAVVELSAVPGPDSLVDRTACLPMEGKIHVCNAKYPDPTWLGLATVWLKDGDHIAMATAMVNDTWFDTSFYNDPNAKRHVLCQEVGHDFGLDHWYGEPTCMDDRNGIFDPAFVSPSAHDYEQLETIYAHLDAGGRTKGRKTSNGNGHRHEAAGDCNDWSCGSTMRVWQEGDYKVVQYVLLAPSSS